MSQQDIGKGIRELLVELKDAATIDAVADDTLLIQDKILDSFDMISLIAMLEEKFSITLDPNDIQPEKFQSIQAINDFLSTRTNDAPGR